jgi:Zn-dependent peptidase ImmA (M78 family)
VKPDDSSLDPADLRAIELRAKSLLDRAAAWDRFPTPIDDILAAARVRVAPVSIFDPASILAYLKDKAARAAAGVIEAALTVKSALSKVFGLYDGDDELIHIDQTVGETKQNFLKLHETAHHDLPTHRKTFRIFQDCEQTLAPEIADQFEREANNFARFALFQGDRYARLAGDTALEIKSPMKLAKQFGASIYAASREFARTHHRSCVVYVLEPIEYVALHGARAQVRRIEPSPSFAAQFGRPQDLVITVDHPLGRLLPIGRRMTRPTTLSMTDRNGTAHECVAEAFDTTHNVIILLFPVRSLTKTMIVVPAGAPVF